LVHAFVSALVPRVPVGSYSAPKSRFGTSGELRVER